MTWPETRWALLDSLQSPTATERDDAMSKLIEIYGPALFAFARREWGAEKSRQDCEDIVADFFVNCLQNEVFQRATPGRGRFRSFLAKSFKNFGLNVIRHDQAGVRTPSAGLTALHTLIEEHGSRFEPRSEETPEETFFRAVRVSLFNSTLKAFERSCTDAGQAKKFQLFLRREIQPLRDGATLLPYALLKVEFDLTSEDAVGRLVREARNEFDEMLSAAVKQDVADDESDRERKLVWASGLRH